MVEGIKAFRIMDRELDPEMEGEAITATRKIKRALLQKHFGRLIDAMYAQDGRPDFQASELRTSNEEEAMHKLNAFGYASAIAISVAVGLPGSSSTALAQSTIKIGISGTATGPNSPSYLRTPKAFVFISASSTMPAA